MAVIAKASSFLRNFVEFLDRSDIISSAAAFVLGISANNFFRTVTDETVVNAVNTYSGLSETKLRFGRLEVHYGMIVAQLINLLAVAVAVYLFILAAKVYLGWT